MQVHQQVPRIDLQRSGSRIKAQLLTLTLVVSQALHQTPFMHDKESIIKALIETEKTQTLEPTAQEQDWTGSTKPHRAKNETLEQLLLVALQPTNKHRPTEKLVAAVNNET
jgi:hypothetical protein